MTCHDTIDWAAVGDLVYEILLTIRKNPGRFTHEAKRRGISVDQLAAAAIAEAIREVVESKVEIEHCKSR